MKPPLRIAVLECDVPLDKIDAKYGSYGAIFTQLLRRGAQRVYADEPSRAKLGLGEQESILEVSCWNVVHRQLYPPLEEIDAVLLTGSRHNAFDNDPWIVSLVKYIKTVLASRRVRAIGVCFGHQVLARALEVKVDRSQIGWEVAVVDVQLTEKGKEVMGLENTMRIHQMHRDAVYVYPADIEPLGMTARCEIQGMYSRNRLISVQGHPEFTGEIQTEILTARHAQGLFTDEEFEEAMARAEGQHDGDTIAAAFVRFLLVD